MFQVCNTLILGCQNETIRAEDKREKFFVQPSFPNVNNAEFDCIWRLQAPEGMRIKITWPVFHLDTCHGSGGNKLLGNAVTIVDGKADDTTNDFVQFCGHKAPPDFVSSTRDLHIMLKQKKQEHGKGMVISSSQTKYLRTWNSEHLGKSVGRRNFIRISLIGAPYTERLFN